MRNRQKQPPHRAGTRRRATSCPFAARVLHWRRVQWGVELARHLPPLADPAPATAALPFTET
jgi:hypothetical protein